MDKNHKQQNYQSSNNAYNKEISKSDRSTKTGSVDYHEDLGEENVELVDSEWADFERALRYNINYHFSKHL